jgi:hypothetical protein
VIVRARFVLCDRACRSSALTGRFIVNLGQPLLACSASYRHFSALRRALARHNKVAEDMAAIKRAQAKRDAPDAAPAKRKAAAAARACRATRAKV